MIYEYVDLARELKKKRTMKHESEGDTNCNSCAQYSHERIDKGTGGVEIRGRGKTIQTTALLKSARILRRVLETRGDLLSLKLLWETIS